MVCRLNQSYYPDTESTSPCPKDKGYILIMQSAWLGSDKYQFKGHWFDSMRIQTCRHELEPSIFAFPDLPEWEVGTLLIWPLQPVPCGHHFVTSINLTYFHFKYLQIDPEKKNLQGKSPLNPTTDTILLYY